ncbi:MAG TPA: hypothetical protein VF771_20160 [Longimicrobiaceae bacterium]
MYGMIRSALAVAALALVAACGDRSVVAPEGPAAAKGGTVYPMTFTVTQSFSGGMAQTVTGGVGTIDFTGTLQTPTPCYDVTATNLTGRAIVATVTATDLGGICTQVITWNDYAGQLTGIPAGSHAFKLVHVVGGRSTTMWSGTVNVM